MKKITGLLKRMFCLVLCAMMIFGLNTTTYASYNHMSKKQWKKAVKNAKKKFVLKPTYCSDPTGKGETLSFDFDQLMTDNGGYFIVSIEADEPVMTRVICRELDTIGSGREYFDLSFDEPVNEYKADKTFMIDAHSNVYFIVDTTDPDVEVRVTVKGVKYDGEKPAKFVIDRW